jgi:hypothetical protein
LGVSELRPVSEDVFADVCRKLSETGIEFIVVGGQACNFWAEKYRPTEPALGEHEPFATMDLDFCASADVESKLLSVDIALLPKRRRTLPSPVACAFQYISGQEEVLVQILRTFYRLKLEDVLKTYRSFEWHERGLTVNVMHPLLILEEKLFASLGINQFDPDSGRRVRQDEKHLRMSILFVAAFISEAVGRGQAREVIRMCQHVLKLAQMRYGIRAYRELKISVENAIPVGTIIESSDPQLIRFGSEEFRRKWKIISEKRNA